MIKKMPKIKNIQTKIYLLIIIAILLPVRIESLTDLTYLNCPDKFDITTANASNPSQKIVNFFYSAYDNDKHHSRV